MAAARTHTHATTFQITGWESRAHYCAGGRGTLPHHAGENVWEWTVCVTVCVGSLIMER